MTGPITPATYECFVCQAACTKGTLVAFRDGTSVAVPLCPDHRNLLRKPMELEGVPVHDAGRLN